MAFIHDHFQLNEVAGQTCPGVGCRLPWLPDVTTAAHASLPRLPEVNWVAPTGLLKSISPEILMLYLNHITFNLGSGSKNLNQKKQPKT